MAAVYNPTPFSLFSAPLGRSIAGDEVIDGLEDELADRICASGVFVRGVVVVPDEPAVEKRPVGRPTSKRGSVEVEEVTEGHEVETR